jgi:hypothetical protein
MRERGEESSREKRERETSSSLHSFLLISLFFPSLSGRRVHLRYVKLPKGTYAKLRPVRPDLLDSVKNPKALLETLLRHFATLVKVRDSVSMSLSAHRSVSLALSVSVSPSICLCPSLVSVPRLCLSSLSVSLLLSPCLSVSLSFFLLLVLGAISLYTTRCPRTRFRRYQRHLSLSPPGSVSFFLCTSVSLSISPCLSPLYVSLTSFR